MWSTHQRPWCVSHICILNTSLGLSCGIIYADCFPFLAEDLDVVTLCMFAASGSMSVGKGDFGLMAFWGLAPECLNHNHWGPDAGHFVMACATGQGGNSLYLNYTLAFALKLKKIRIVRRKYVSYVGRCKDCGWSELWEIKMDILSTNNENLKF